MPGFLRSSTLRFVALVFALQIGSAALLLLVVHHRTSEELEQIALDEATELRDDLVASFDEGGVAAIRALALSRVARSQRDESVILVVGPHGHVVTGNLGAWPPDLKPDGRWHQITLYRVDSDRPERMIASVTRLSDGSRLLAGHVIEGSLQLRAVVEEAMLSVLLLALPVALLGAMIAGRVINSRVSGIAATVQSVRTGDLSRRVRLDGSGDAFEALGIAINAMLDRIEALVTELRIVTDGLAHDLRSPLTRLRASLDRALADTQDDTALAALQSVSVEADGLLAMLSTALQISRAEAGIGRDRFVAVDLPAMLADLAELYGPLAEERGFTLEVAADDDIQLSAHRELLGQALANLIDNAMKYARPDSRIRLRAAMAGSTIELGVADDGPGIPAERREEAVRRYARLDPSRHIAGAGLGLSLVAAVARLHGGAMILRDLDHGFEVVLRLPPNL
ncbi:sensor histidine kinase [Sphingomonas sp. DBB INV C78]|uniref:sensor histidine kinase n=1 Tax=Sphingomonas sp. DBB INV C78 TaxID=3349434 RepID=UPI0036D438D3